MGSSPVVPTKKETTMTHTSKKGTIWYNCQRGNWTAEFRFKDGKKSFCSANRQDCEIWLNEIRGKGSQSSANEINVKEVVRMIKKNGESKPQQVPDFPSYFLTAKGNLYSYKNMKLRELKLQNGHHYTMCKESSYITCSIDKLRWCIEHQVSPLKLSECKLSVKKGYGELIDVTEMVRQSIQKNREEKISKYANDYLHTIERWCHNVQELYSGNHEAMIILREIIHGLRKEVEHYVRNNLRVYDSKKVKFITDEVESETMLRVLNKNTVICNPYLYMQHLSKGLHAKIKQCRGVARQEGSDVRIVGRWTKQDFKEMYNY